MSLAATVNFWRLLKVFPELDECVENEKVVGRFPKKLGPSFKKKPSLIEIYIIDSQEIDSFIQKFKNLLSTGNVNLSVKLEHPEMVITLGIVLRMDQHGNSAHEAEN